MVRLLLDTHLVLAIVNGEPDRLPASCRRVLSDPGHGFGASVASLWEIAIKFRRGKLPLKTELGRLSDYLEASKIGVLPVSAEHAIAEALPVPRTRDPFDRLLLAVCQVEQLSLLTMDRALASHPLAWPLHPA